MSLQFSSNRVISRSKSWSCLDFNSPDASVEFSPLEPTLSSYVSICNHYTATMIYCSLQESHSLDLDFKFSKPTHQPSMPVLKITDRSYDSKSLDMSAFQPLAPRENKIAASNNDFKDFGVNALELVRACKKEIVNLQDTQTRISQDLDATLKALAHATQEGEDDRIFSLSAHSAMGMELLETLQAHLTTTKTLENETSMRDGLVKSLRTARAQYTQVARALREQSSTNTSLNSELCGERAAHQLAQDALSKAITENMALAESNRQLITHIATLNKESVSEWLNTSADPMAPSWLEDIPQSQSTDLTGSYTNRRAIHTLQPSVPETYKPQRMPFVSSEIAWSSADPQKLAHQTKSIAIQHKLHIAEEQLALSEQRRHTLSTKVFSLQKHIIACVDECATALETERDLRYEIEARAHDLLQETLLLKSQTRVSESRSTQKIASIVEWRETGGHVYQMNAIAVAAFERCDSLERENLKLQDVICELSKKFATSTREVEELTCKMSLHSSVVTKLKAKAAARGYAKTRARQVCYLGAL